MSATLFIGLTATWLGQLHGAGANNLALVAGLLSVMLMGWGLLMNKSERNRVSSALHKRFFSRFTRL